MRGIEIEVTTAAVAAARRLSAVTGGRLSSHPAADGGLICENGHRARPVMWRILPDGGVQPDRRYSFTHRGFVSPVVPDGI
jgi:hypothetical protein